MIVPVPESTVSEANWSSVKSATPVGLTVIVPLLISEVLTRVVEPAWTWKLPSLVTSIEHAGAGVDNDARARGLQLPADDGRLVPQFHPAAVGGADSPRRALSDGHLLLEAERRPAIGLH